MKVSICSLQLQYVLGEVLTIKLFARYVILDDNLRLFSQRSLCCCHNGSYKSADEEIVRGGRGRIVKKLNLFLFVWVAKILIIIMLIIAVLIIVVLIISYCSSTNYNSSDCSDFSILVSNNWICPILPVFALILQDFSKLSRYIQISSNLELL